MAKRPTARKVTGDEERVLHFEWHAAHFESFDQFLPERPSNSNMVYGMPTPDFHSSTIRFAILRKFVMANEAVRLDRVAESMKKLTIGDQPHLVTNLNDLIGEYKALTKSPMLVKLEDQQLDRDDIYENVVNGLLLHSDVERRDLFDKLHIGIIHGDVLHQGKLRRAVLSVLATVREGRELGYLSVGEPYRRVWEPRPRSTDVSYAEERHTEGEAISPPEG